MIDEVFLFLSLSLSHITNDKYHKSHLKQVTLTLISPFLFPNDEETSILMQSHYYDHSILYGPGSFAEFVPGAQVLSFTESYFLFVFFFSNFQILFTFFLNWGK